MFIEFLKCVWLAIIVRSVVMLYRVLQSSTCFVKFRFVMVSAMVLLFPSKLVFIF